MCVVSTMLGYPLVEDSTEVFETRFPICCLRTDRSLGEKSWAPIWAYVAWSLNQMYIGCYPKTSFTNQRLNPHGGNVPGGPMYNDEVRFRLTEVRGDWKHHQQVWGMVKAAFTSNNVCHCCRASRTETEVSMLEFTTHPRWESTIRSQREFLLQIMNSEGCNLIFVKGFHYSMIRWCSMHSIQLGVGLFLNGGCWHELVKVQHFEGNSVADRFREAYRKFKIFCKTHKIECSQPCFKPWMYVSSGEESCTFRSKVPLSNKGWGV